MRPLSGLVDGVAEMPGAGIEIRSPTDGEAVTILIADDDPDDRELTEEALRSAHVTNEIRLVADGEELMQYLRRKGQYDGDSAPRPGIILLDLNMPRKDGREALSEIKSDPDLRRIPVIVLTTSSADEDVLGAYDLGVNSFITKPVTFGGMVEVMRAWTRYWFEIAELPNGGFPGGSR